MSLAELEIELKKAVEAHESACAEYQRASNAKTDTMNRVNRAQKAIDEAINELQSEAPYATDWHSKRIPGIRVG